MQFTREPIVETIITPKEGYKLSIKNSKGGNIEEYLVDAVEVVSFGQTFFYRSLERPKSFLLPVSDYDVAEVKEVRLVVKNPNVDKLIKIAGGKETSHSHSHKQQAAKVQEPVEVPSSEEPSASADQSAAPSAARRDRKKGRRGKRVSQDKERPQGEEAIVVPLIFSSLLTPPDTLISETLLKTVKNLETPVTQTPLSGNDASEYHDPLFSPRVMQQDVEDKGLVSEEPKHGEKLEESFQEEIEIPDHLKDHTHL